MNFRTLLQSLLSQSFFVKLETQLVSPYSTEKRNAL
jgi:hypothetical protein